MLERFLLRSICSSICSSIFEEKLVDEHARIATNEPLWTFEYYSNSYSRDDTTYTVEVYPPLVAFYTQVGSVSLCFFFGRC